MPHTRSAIKRLKQNDVRRKRNRAAIKKLKVQSKETHAAIATNPAGAADSIKANQKKLDQAAAKGYIHPNKAARLKSRLVKKLRTATSAAAAK